MEADLIDRTPTLVRKEILASTTVFKDTKIYFPSRGKGSDFFLIFLAICSCTFVDTQRHKFLYSHQKSYTHTTNTKINRTSNTTTSSNRYRIAL